MADAEYGPCSYRLFLYWVITSARADNTAYSTGRNISATAVYLYVSKVGSKFGPETPVWRWWMTGENTDEAFQS